MDGVNALAERRSAAAESRFVQAHERSRRRHNGGGKADILWQNDDGTPGVWLMDGTNVLQTGGALSNPGAAWHII